MTLENIVPSLEDCQRIPQGNFEKTVMMWEDMNRVCWKVSRRSKFDIGKYWPAPTLAEILEEFATVGCVVRVSDVGGNVEYTTSLPLSDIEEANTNPATAALRLWFRLKGVQG